MPTQTTLTVPAKQTVFPAGQGSSQTDWTKSGVRGRLRAGAMPHPHPLEPTGRVNSHTGHKHKPQDPQDMPRHTGRRRARGFSPSAMCSETRIHVGVRHRCPPQLLPGGPEQHPHSCHRLLNTETTMKQIPLCTQTSLHACAHTHTHQTLSLGDQHGDGPTELVPLCVGQCPHIHLSGHQQFPLGAQTPQTKPGGLSWHLSVY